MRATDGGSLDEQALIGAPQEQAFEALYDAGFKWNRIRQTLDGTHEACTVAAINPGSDADRRDVVVWWPAAGEPQCGPPTASGTRGEPQAAGDGRGADDDAGRGDT